MCESDVYMLRNGQEELLMEKVDRVIPGEDDTIFLENIFGERRVVKARLREMELVRHRILLEDLPAAAVVRDEELWLEPDTDHGHFHEGEEVVLRLYKGYNMQSNAGANLEDVQAVMVSGSAKKGLAITPASRPVRDPQRAGSRWFTANLCSSTRD
jgi:predicted RNA-binding protein